MYDSNQRPEGRYIVPALAQGLAALSLFSRDCKRLTAPQIAKELSLPRTTVFRMLHTLLATGFVVREDDERYYRLGPAILGSGFAYLASLDFVEVAQPVLNQLREQTGMSAHMAIRDGRDLVYVARYAADTTVRSSVNIGTRFPVHATLMGRMLICELTGEELNLLFGDVNLPKFSDQTPTTIPDLTELLASDRARGFAASQSFFERGVASVAAPVRDSSGKIVAAINVTSVDATVDPDSMNGPVKDKVLSAAREITRWISQDGIGQLAMSG